MASDHFTQDTQRAMDEIGLGDFVELIGPYYGDPWGGHGRHTVAVGWQGLYVARIIEESTQSPYLINTEKGLSVGWAPIGSLTLIRRANEY